MKHSRFLHWCGVTVLGMGFGVTTAKGSAFVLGAYYRLGDDDPGATAGATGNDPTVDSFGGLHNLSRFGLPSYSSDVPARGPAGDVLSMQYANVGLGGPAVLGFYGSAKSISIDSQGYALEAWVKAGSNVLDAPTDERLIAYDGDPSANGFGLFQNGSEYVARIGTVERKIGPVETGVWHHLAYVYSLGNSSYYFDGNLVGESNTDPTAIGPSGGMWVGGEAGAGGASDQFLFNGLIDEVRLQSFNPIAAGAFDPTAFLITPEPATASLIGGAALILLLRRRSSSWRLIRG